MYTGHECNHPLPPRQANIQCPGPPRPAGLPVILADRTLVQTHVLQEVQCIHQVLQRAAALRLQRNGTPWQKKALFLIGGLVFFGLLIFWSQLPIELLLVISLAVLGCALVALQNMAEEWTRRDVDTLEQLGGATTREQALIKQLLPYSRASLLYVAASARAAETQVGGRLTVLLGPNRAGGLIGALLVLLGVFSAGKYLQDTQVIVPLINVPVTASGVIAVVLLGYCFVAALLLAGHSVNALSQYAELLDRVADLKKNLAEDQEAAQESGSA